jgi:plastocyanin
MGARPAAGQTADARRQRGVTEAVVWVQEIPEKAERALTHRGFLFFRRRVEPGVHVVTQRARFEPRVTVVTHGARVAFHNADHVYHNVFSVSPGRRLDTGKCPPGRRDTLAFTRPGVINLHCDIHPDELGWVVVTPNHAFTRPDSLGRFRLPALPSGTYTLKVFHPRRGEWSRQVELPRRGDAVIEVVR